MQNENEAYVDLLYGHLQGMIYRLREIPPDRWEWQPALPAPSPRILAEHAWSWLVCDRQHIFEPDVTRHSRVPDPPAGQQAMCDTLAEEAERWRSLLQSLTPEQLLEPRKQFGKNPANVRWFVIHMIQNVIYKHGQLATIYFALGLDGTGPYTAPFPSDGYDSMREFMGRPLFKAAVDGDLAALQEALDKGADANERNSEGSTALMWAAYLGQVDIVKALLARGADVQAADNHGTTALKCAQWGSHAEVAELLKQAGAKE